MSRVMFATVARVNVPVSVDVRHVVSGAPKRVSVQHVVMSAPRHNQDGARETHITHHAAAITYIQYMRVY